MGPRNRRIMGWGGGPKRPGEALLSRLDGDGELLAAELLDVELGPFPVGQEEEGDAGVVGLECRRGRPLEIKRREVADGLDDIDDVVRVVVVQQDAVFGQAIDARGRGRLSRRGNRLGLGVLGLLAHL